MTTVSVGSRRGKRRQLYSAPSPRVGRTLVCLSFFETQLLGKTELVATIRQTLPFGPRSWAEVMGLERERRRGKRSGSFVTGAPGW